MNYYAWDVNFLTLQPKNRERSRRDHVPTNTAASLATLADQVSGQAARNGQPPATLQAVSQT